MFEVLDIFSRIARRSVLRVGVFFRDCHGILFLVAGYFRFVGGNCCFAVLLQLALSHSINGNKADGFVQLK